MSVDVQSPRTSWIPLHGSGATDCIPQDHSAQFCCFDCASVRHSVVRSKHCRKCGIQGIVHSPQRSAAVEPATIADCGLNIEADVCTLRRQQSECVLLHTLTVHLQLTAHTTTTIVELKITMPAGMALSRTAITSSLCCSRPFPDEAPHAYCTRTWKQLRSEQMIVPDC